jgi:hypothetical protein
MKKVFIHLFVFFVGLFSIPVIAGDYPNGNLMDIINGATDGEVINLTGDAYTFSPRANLLTKSLTIQASPTLLARPVITVGQAGIQFIATGGTPQTLTLKGLEFNGNALATGLTQGKNVTGGNFTVTIDNCKTSNFATGTSMFFYTALAGLSVYGNLTVTNSEFIGPFPLTLLATAGTTTSPDNISFSNCYITGFNTANTSITVVATTALSGISIDHCTFQNGATGSRRALTLPSGTPQVVKNCIFVDQPGTGANTIAANVANDKNVVFNAGLATRWANLGTLLTIDPAVGVNGVTTESSYISAGSDGKTIGYVGPNGISTAINNQTQAASKALSIIQNGTSFTINSPNATFAVYATNGSQVANGKIVNEKINLNLNKGIYILKSNGKVAKFTVK